MKRFGQIVLIILFIGIIISIPVLTRIEKNQVISQFENRKLAERPILTKSTLISGEYFGKWENYLSDHIFGRNLWIQGYTYMNMAVLGKSNINNIVIGNDGFLLPFFPYDGKQEQKNSERNLEAMSRQLKELQDKLAQYGGSFYFAGIPSQASYHREDYPKHLQSLNEFMGKTEKLFFDKLDKLGVSYINMNTIFRRNAEAEYFYKTDHHFNLEGAYTTYYEIIKNIRQGSGEIIAPPLEKSELDIITLPNPFGGSRNRQIYYMQPTEEHIQLAYPKHKTAYEKYVNGKADNTLYYIKDDTSAMITYSVYMGGDWAETLIKTNNDKLPNLLVFGDSFTNAIEPLLFQHFNETRILDLRYYTKMSLYEYIDKYKPDVVLMVRDDLNYGSLEGNGGFKGENVKK